VVTDYGIPAERVTAVGGGVNFDPLPYPIYGRERPAHKILWIGLDFERKGGDILIEAFQRVRERFLDAELIMVGARSSVEVPGVTYAGIVTSRDELAKFYLDATIFCLPARHEPYGLVVQEAMAFGLPCIATRVGALDEIIDDAVTGRIVAAENVDELADELLVLLDDPDRCDQMGRAGRVKVENSLTWASVAERMINTLTQPAIEPTDK
jgi:glycosyltransferase involved in cell wall biosynthesis